MSGASETLVRDGLARLEADFRELVLVALADGWQRGVAAPEMFAALANLQRPSWGSWNGLLRALSRARRGALREATAAERERLARAKVLGRVLAVLRARVPDDVAASLGPLARLAEQRLEGTLRIDAALALPIGLRNRVAHDAPDDAAWWNDAAAALKPLLAWHRDTRPLASVLEGAARPEPFFLERDGSTWAFCGLGRDQAGHYATDSGKTAELPETRDALLGAFRALLGQEEGADEDFRALLGRAAPDELKGVFLGGYLVGPPVGEGGYGRVHRAEQLSTGRRVALKILHDGTPEDARLRFEQEARFLAELDHPGIVAVYDHGEATWRAPRHYSLEGEAWFADTFARSAPVKHYIALAWVEGRFLDDVVREHGSRPLPLGEVTELFAQAAEALHAVHVAGLVHRDVKPANLVVDEAGRLRLLDFGIARSAHEERAHATKTGKAIGTPAYMSPEQIRAREAEAAVGPASDVYSLAATFYEVYCGKRVFERDRTSADDLRSLPWELQVLLLGGLEADIADRPASMEALASDLRRVQNDEPIRYRRPSLIRRMQLGYRRNRVVANLVAVFLLLLAGGAIGTTTYRAHQRRQTAEQATATAEAAHREDALVEAEDAYRRALFAVPGFDAAQRGLVRTALDHFELALLARNWRQAREKLLLARSAGLDATREAELEARLEARSTERERHIRGRVETLMQDAIRPEGRTASHDRALNELVSLKDPVTLEALLPYADSTQPTQRKLALDVFRWIGDERVVRTLQSVAVDADAPLALRRRAWRTLFGIAPSDLGLYLEVREQLRPGNPAYDGLQEAHARYRQAFVEPVYAHLYGGSEAPPSATRLLQASLDHLARGEDELATRCADAAVRQAPERAGVLRTRAFVRMRDVTPEVVLAWLEEAARVEPHPPVVAWIQAWAVFRIGDYERFLVQQRDARLATAEDLLSGFAAAYARVLAADAGFPDVAHPAFERVLGKNGAGALGRLFADEALADPTGLIAIFVALERDDRRAADAGSERLSSRTPNAPVALYVRGRHLFDTSRPEEALEALRATAEAMPQHRSVYRTRARAREATGDLPGAAVDLTTHLELRPNDAYAWRLLARVRLAQEDHEAAQAALVRARELAPADTRTKEVEIAYHVALEQWAEAEAALESFAKADPDRTETWENLAEVRRRSGDEVGAAEAAAEADRLRRAADDRAFAERLARARRHLAVGLVDRALEALDAIVETWPRRAAARFLRAGLHVDAKRWEDAERDLTTGLEVAPRSFEALRTRARVRLERANARGALADARAAIALTGDDAEAHRLLGLSHARLGHAGAAIAALDRAFALAPATAGVHVVRGDMRRLAGDLGGALEDFEKAIALAPAHLDGHAGRMLVRLAQGDVEAAVADLDWIVSKTQARPPLTCFALATWWARKGSEASAYRSIRDAVEARPGNGEYLVLLAELERRRKRPDEARRILDRAVAAWPEYARTWISLGQVLYALERYAEAEAAYAKALDLAPDGFSVLNLRGMSRHDRGDLAGAIEDYSRYLARNPDSGVVHFNRALAHEEAEDLPAALADLDRAAALSPEDADVFRVRARVRRKTEDLEGALADLNRWIELEPEALAAWNRRGLVRRSLGDLEGAVADYTHFLEQRPDSAAVHWNRALARQDAGNLEGALGDLDRALALAPDDPDFHAVRAEVREGLGDLEGALADLTRWAELDPESRAVWKKRGLVRFRLDRYREAIADFDHALRLQPGHVVTLHNRARAYEELGEVKRALQDLEEALTIQPDFEPAREARARLLENR